MKDYRKKFMATARVVLLASKIITDATISDSQVEVVFDEFMAKKISPWYVETEPVERILPSSIFSTEWKDDD